jgi:hypothetical protein
MKKHWKQVDDLIAAIEQTLLAHNPRLDVAIMALSMALVEAIIEAEGEQREQLWCLAHGQLHDYYVHLQEREEGPASEDSSTVH